MSYQRSKAPLSLMEQLIMVFVFAFAAAICLQAFVYSDRLSKNGTTEETAAMRATEVIETCKAYHGDLKKAAEKLGGTLIPSSDDSGDSIEKKYDDDELRVVLDAGDVEKTGGEASFQRAQVKVWEYPEEGKQEADPVYTVDVAWQLAEQTAK
ncbi:MAG: hypothetical protein IKQ97_03390 [Eubacterium sp.]|nr:hypothetical protein [Eubacterium sp.]